MSIRLCPKEEQRMLRTRDSQDEVASKASRALRSRCSAPKNAGLKIRCPVRGTGQGRE